MIKHLISTTKREMCRAIAAACRPAGPRSTQNLGYLGGFNSTFSNEASATKAVNTLVFFLDFPFLPFSVFRKSIRITTMALVRYKFKFQNKMEN